MSKRIFLSLAILILPMSVCYAVKSTESTEEGSPPHTPPRLPAHALGHYGDLVDGDDKKNKPRHPMLTRGTTIYRLETSDRFTGRKN